MCAFSAAIPLAEFLCGRAGLVLFSCAHVGWVYGGGLARERVLLLGSCALWGPTALDEKGSDWGVVAKCR